MSDDVMKHIRPWSKPHADAAPQTTETPKLVHEPWCDSHVPFFIPPDCNCGASGHIKIVLET